MADPVSMRVSAGQVSVEEDMPGLVPFIRFSWAYEDQSVETLLQTF